MIEPEPRVLPKLHSVRLTGGCDGRQDAAARLEDVGVARTGEALGELVCARAGPHGMGVGIDEARESDEARAVHHTVGSRSRRWDPPRTHDRGR